MVIYLSALECESGEVVWVLFVPAESEQRQLLGILIQDGRMLKVPAGIVCTNS